MPYKVEKLPDEPILVTAVINPFKVSEEFPLYVEAVVKALDEASEPLYFISDAVGLKVTFGDVVSGLAFVTKGKVTYVNHKNMRKMIAIADSDLIRMAVNAVGQKQYGEYVAQVYPTTEAALEDIRKELAGVAAAAA
jgi:hypothetical protein